MVKCNDGADVPQPNWMLIRRRRSYILCINLSVVARVEITLSLVAFQEFVMYIVNCVAICCGVKTK